MNSSKNSTYTIGHVGETVASNYLISKNYGIVCRNYRCPYGETDIIALDGNVYVFVEVKLRTESYVEKYGRPSRAVNAQKKRRLLASAKYYLGENKLHDTPARIDIMEIYKTEHEDCVSFRINHIRNAIKDDEPRSTYSPTYYN